MVTSGTITNRIDRMAARSLVRRTRDAQNRRSVPIELTELTDEGRDLVDSVIGDHLASYRRLVSSLDTTQRETLNGLLCPLLEDLADTELG